MPGAFTESRFEDAALAWLEALGYAVLHVPDIAAGEPGAERGDPNYRDVVLVHGLGQSAKTTLAQHVGARAGYA